MRFPVENIRDALAPSNFPWSNPAAIKAAASSRGGSLVRGAGQLASDMRWIDRLRHQASLGEDDEKDRGHAEARETVWSKWRARTDHREIQ